MWYVFGVCSCPIAHKFQCDFFLLQGQYRFVCECICVAYAKIARTESIESSASIEDNNVHGDETQANGDTTAVAVVAVTDGIENVNDSRSDAK